MDSPLEEFADAAVDAFANGEWYEAQIEVRPAVFYHWLDTEYSNGQILMYHHFYEPWHTTGAVVRLFVFGSVADDVVADIGAWEGVVGIEPWDRESEDARYYGMAYMMHAMTLFQGSSRLADHPDGDRMTSKLVHCLLNTRRMTRRQEAFWAFRFAYRSLLTEPILWWRARKTGRKWWER